MSGRIYLDWNASAPLRAEARDAVLAAMDVTGNPSSVHAEGRSAKGLVERARAQVAEAIGATNADIVFTSGATEAAALALSGRNLSSADVEHDAVMAWTRGDLAIDGVGRISVEDPTASCVQLANAETGVIQDIPARLAVTDATQAFGKIPVAIDWLECDMALVSAHKLGGPHGVGALIVKQGIDVAARSKGGGQEMGRRSGTENLAGIAGFGAAAQAAARDPTWAMVNYPKIDYQDLYYYAQPKSMVDKPKSLDDVDPKLLATYAKLGIPLKEQMILAGVEGSDDAPAEGRQVAVDAVFDSVSLGATFQEELAKAGVIFCSIGEAIENHPELVKKYLGSVVPITDNFFATLNSAVFSAGSFVYVPPGVRCPMELSTYFRINAENTGQFERTLIIADKGSYVSYLEGCTAPQRDINQLHAAVVEIVALEDAEVKYSTVQNWYPGDENGVGGIYNFVTKRADCRGHRAKVMWTQVETGSAITWKYPSCILRGDDSQGEFYSIAVANNYQQADTGTKMVHLGRNTRSRIVSKGISAGHAQNTYRGLVSMHPRAKNSRNHTQCDSLLIGDKCGAHTVPYIEVKNNSSRVEHEATTSKVDDDQLFYCRQRGMDEEEAVALVVNGFCKEVLQALPMEFAMEAQQLVAISLEGSVG